MTTEPKTPAWCTEAARNSVCDIEGFLRAIIKRNLTPAEYRVLEQRIADQVARHSRVAAKDSYIQEMIDHYNSMELSARERGDTTATTNCKILKKKARRALSGEEGE